jgi:hypothetical protein
MTKKTQSHICERTDNRQDIQIKKRTLSQFNKENSCEKIYIFVFKLFKVYLYEVKLFLARDLQINENLFLFFC